MIRLVRKFIWVALLLALVPSVAAVDVFHDHDHNAAACPACILVATVVLAIVALAALQTLDCSPRRIVLLAPNSPSSLLGLSVRRPRAPPAFS